MVKSLDEQKVLIFTGGKASLKDRGLDMLGGTAGGVATVGALRASVQEFMPALGAVMDDVKKAAIGLGLEEVSVSRNKRKRRNRLSWDRFGTWCQREPYAEV